MDAISEPVGLDFGEELEEEEEVDYDMEEEDPATEENPAGSLQGDADAARAEAEKKARAPISWRAWKDPESSDKPSHSGQDRPRRRSRDQDSQERQSKERQRKDRKGSERQRSKDGGSREGRARAVPADTRRRGTLPVESPPRGRVVQIRRSPSRERLVQEHYGNGVLPRRSGSPPGIRRRSKSPLGARRMSRSPLGVRRMSRSPLGIRRRPRSPLPARQLERFRAPPLMRRAAPATLAPRYVDARERSPPPQRILVEIDPRDLPPGGLEQLRGEHLMPRLARLPELLDYQYRGNRAPRIVYDSGPRRDLDERLPPPSRFIPFEERERMSLDRGVLLDRQASDLERMGSRGHLGTDRPAYIPGWQRSPERRPGLLRSRSPPGRRGGSTPIRHASAERLSMPNGLPNGGIREAGIARREGRRKTTGFSSPVKKERASREGGDREQLDPSSKRTEKKTAGDKEGRRKDAKQSAAASAKDEPKDKSRSKDDKPAAKVPREEKAAVKEGRPSSASAKADAKPAKQEAQQPGGDAKVASKSSQRTTEDSKRKAAKGKEESAAAKSSMDKEKATASKPAAKPSVDEKKSSTDKAKASSGKPAAKPSRDQGRPSESSAQANGKHQPSRGAAISKAKEPSTKATATPRAVPHKPSGTRRDDKPAMGPKSAGASDGRQPGGRAVAGKAVKRAEPITSTPSAKRPCTQASLPFAGSGSLSRELPMPPPMDNIPWMPHDHALQVSPTNLPLPPQFVEAPDVPGIASGLPLPPPPPLRPAQRGRLSGYGPPAGNSHPDSGWSDEDIPVQHMDYGYDRQVQEVGVRHVQDAGRRRPLGQPSPGRQYAPRRVREVRQTRFAHRSDNRRSPPGLAASHPDMFEEWFYLDPQGVTHGPNSKWKLRAWLTQLANANDPARHKAFCEVRVWRRDWPASNAVQLLQLLNG